ncbi:hypothetical protein AB4K20DRAFT_1955574 [Rhizopus microsporus]|uniref:Uncharacterized protein n=1 Tax=Rhizopus microsporus TaxID=58291 RepID=A0A1X0RWQ9_RHIZD|nr:hypothetical protein BCV71DRAFT_292289 [Rhizopus microsporus]
MLTTDSKKECNDEHAVIRWREYFRFLQALCTKFYTHIVRPQLEHNLAINRFTVSQLHALEGAQNNDIKKINGARGKAFTKVILHMPELPLMSERVSILQTQFLFHKMHCLLVCYPISAVPEDVSGTFSLVHRFGKWMLSTIEEPDTHSLKVAKRRFQ